MPERVRRCRLIVGPCSSMSVLCREVFGDVGLESGLVRLSRVSDGRVRRSRLRVGTCSTMSGKYRYVFGEVGLVSELVRRSRISVGTRSARSG